MTPARIVTALLVLIAVYVWLVVSTVLDPDPRDGR